LRFGTSYPWIALSVPMLLFAIAASAPAAVDDDMDAALRRALAPHAWMSSLPTWPCRYGARVEQRRLLGERTLRSEGRLYQDCRQGLVWQVDRPLPGARVYARNGNYLSLDRDGVPRRLDGLAERRIGRLLQDLFIGDISALQRDFAHRVDDDGAAPSVRLVPRDAQLASRLDAILISGDATGTTIRVRTAGESPNEMLRLQLSAFELLEGPAGDSSQQRCSGWLGGERDAVRARAEAACDALARPGRWLERARSESR